MNNYSFYIPNNIELIFDFFGDLAIKPNKPYSKKEKYEVLQWVGKLLKSEILYAGEYDNEKKFKKWNLPINEIIQKIECEWNEDLEFPEFYNLVWFSYQKWYIEALKKRGLTETKDWNNFIKNEIGDLEKWIKENKPTRTKKDE